MQLLDLAQADGLAPKKVALTNGGEYHSPCPACGGKDRFIIWDKTNRYLCRCCEKKGDLIQYLRDFHRLSYSEACSYLGVALATLPKKRKLQNFFDPKPSSFPSILWRQKAFEFIQKCHQSLFNTIEGKELFLRRGLSVKTMKTYQVGWNPRSLWILREEWGLSNLERKKIWFPKGPVLPTFDLDTGDPIKLKIRRDDREKNRELPKYVEIPGGMQTPSRYGITKDKPVMIVESEFDAMLVQQLAGDLISCMALGGSSKRPDAETHKFLINAPMILFSLDVDSAGAIAYQWWHRVYPHLKLCLPPVGKSPGDAYEKGIDLRRWIKVSTNLF